VVKVKPVIHPEHGEITAYAQEAAQVIDDTLLANRTIAVTWLSVIIQRKFPMLPRETRRQLAARILEQERKRRKEINDHAA
jgi:hypothetical protein